MSRPEAAERIRKPDPTLPLVAERRWPGRPLVPHASAPLAIEAFQGIVHGLLLGGGTIFAVTAIVSTMQRMLGLSFALPLPVWSQALVVASDFLDCFRHRHEHQSNGRFWRVHSVHHSIRDVHHSIRELSLLAGLAVHPLEPVFTFASTGLVAGLLGLSSEATALGFTIAMIAMGAQHTNTWSRLGWLSSLLAHVDRNR